MADHVHRDLHLLRCMLALRPAGWHTPAASHRLPPTVRLFLSQADTPTLERLLLETARQLGHSTTPPTFTRSELHAAIQAELKDTETSS